MASKLLKVMAGEVAPDDAGLRLEPNTKNFYSLLEFRENHRVPAVFVRISDIRVFPEGDWVFSIDVLV
jgi:hypothetical protein